MVELEEHSTSVVLKFDGTIPPTPRLWKIQGVVREKGASELTQQNIVFEGARNMFRKARASILKVLEPLNYRNEARLSDE